ncbi:ISNCY family transposase [Noviherbaspirillum pedocola]|uniref:ISNCY family transposase n=1 Tax=Noviherbaspirillum pedocola TaxID=2801341 RepID=A0A934W7F2_9BURK|nr:ISNCY family transposase [Noviherbaspirillum pedocola]MBK4737367.1 ISNCY family transposase [Noviherbaspirillum pedocola]
MAQIETITMSMREIDRLKVIQAVADGHLKPMQAAQRLTLTTRQIQRLVNRFLSEGVAGLVSRKRGRPGNRQLAPGLANLALTIIRDRYADFGPTLAREKLSECHGISISTETIRRLMTEAGLWIPRRQRPATIYQPRNRRHCVGELVQIDGSDHAWFEDRAPTCTLLVYVDDATSQLLQLHFTPSESTFSYFEATRAYIEQHGKPLAFYSDKASVFRVNQKNATGGDGCTQFGRALFELNIEGICANSSQAKGRVERANLTLQDRLVKELRLQGISTMAAANAYAPTFVADYNRRFAKPPRNDFDAHRPLRDDEDLDLIFTERQPRRVSHSLTLQYDKMLYLLADTPASRRLIGKYVEVYEYPDGRIEVRADGIALPYTTYDRLCEIDQGAIVENKRLGHVLQVVQAVQQQRDDRRSHSVLVRTHRGVPAVPKKAAPGKKTQRSLNADDIAQAIQQTQSKATAPPNSLTEIV